MSTDVALQPPADGIAALAWSPDSTRLLVASWDSTLQLHTFSEPPTPPQIFSDPRPVLATTFGSSASTAYSGGVDHRVREWDLEAGQCRVLGKHDDAVSSMAWLPAHNLLVTGSWDRTLKVWNPALPEPLVTSLALPERAYTLSYAPASDRLLLSMAHRHVLVYRGAALAQATPGAPVEPESRRESALKMLSRTVACMADGKGWASASIEGRIAVEYFDTDAETQANKYAFRAHRQTVDGVDYVYPINAIAYHPIHNTFASGGSDATLSIWDHTAKKRMRVFADYAPAVSALAFSPDGTRLAVGCSYEHDNAVKDVGRLGVRLVVKTTALDDCKPKPRA
ncbi:mitotic spindle checkpoint protein Bub3 [Cryptotrichosporon argae]